MRKHTPFQLLPFLLGSMIFLFSMNPLYAVENLSTAANTQALLDSSIVIAIKGDLKQAEEIYLQALDNANKTGEIILLENVQMLFSIEEKKECDKTTDKKSFIKDFWLARDPTPKTATNERLQEHLYRTGYARVHYHVPGAEKSFDERGIFYIKYGDPTSRCEQAGDVISIPIDGQSGEKYELLHGGGGKPVDQMRTLAVYPTETWVYNYENTNRNESLIIDFANKGSTSFKQIDDLSEAFDHTLSLNDGGSLFAPGWLTIVRMYQQRYQMNPAFYGNVSLFSKSHLDFVNNVQEIRNKKRQMFLRAPAELFTQQLFPQKRMPVQIESACFRAEGGKTKQEIYYSFPTGSLKFTKPAETQIGEFNQEFVLRTDGKNDLYYDFQTIKLEFGKNEISQASRYTGQINASIPAQPSKPIAFLTIEDINDEKMSVLSHRLTSRDFSGDSLMISDIKFSYDVAPSQEKDSFTRNGLRIIPLTTNRLALEKPVSVYFEIYKLQPGGQNKVKYKVQYIVQKTTTDSANGPLVFDVGNPSLPPPPAMKGSNDYISMENEMSGEGEEQQHNFTVDLSKLNEGDYNFIIYVIDSNSSRYAYTYRHIVLERDNKKKK